MKKIAFFDTKEYEKPFFEEANKDDFTITYFETKLTPDSVSLARGFDGVIAFVNDNITKEVIDSLQEMNVPVIAMRSAGYNNVDFKEAYEKVTILRVPYYSPYAVAEHAVALLLSLNRKIHKAYNRTREYNFSLMDLIGFDLYGKRVGVIGTGKIGKVFAGIMEGFGCDVVCYDKFPSKDSQLKYVPLDELLTTSDIVSLHCPLTDDTYHIIGLDAIDKMKHGVYIINTSRGALIDSYVLLDALRKGKIGAAGLDVYEEEANLFFEDFSNSTIRDEVLSVLLTLPNVIVTSHQAYLTKEALGAIANVTMDNLRSFFNGQELKNEVCYYCKDGGSANAGCHKAKNGRCF